MAFCNTCLPSEGHHSIFVVTTDRSLFRKRCVVGWSKRRSTRCSLPREFIAKGVHCQGSSLPREFIAKGSSLPREFIAKGVHRQGSSSPREFIAKGVHRQGSSSPREFIAKGSPWENGHVESFNGKFRDELLNREIFLSIEEAEWVIDRWRSDYNNHRVLSSLNYQTPAAFAAGCVFPASATPQPPDHSRTI